MGTLAFAGGTSHAPQLVLGPELWSERAESDRGFPRFLDCNGQVRTFDELEAAANGRFAAEITAEVFQRRYDQCQAALDRLAADVAAADLDAMIIVGDDQLELFGYDNMPALAIFRGQRILTHAYDLSKSARWMHVLAAAQAIDANHEFVGNPAVADQLIAGLMERGVDVAASDEVRDPAQRGFGHAFGFVIKRVLGETVPVVPVMINTYFPPNQPTPARCVAVGRALRGAIDDADIGRVGLIASGGLSHFVINEELDALVLEAIRSSKADALAELPVHLLEQGTSEIRNWIVAAAAADELDLNWVEYVPCYRSLAGTGCAMAFASWS